MADMIDVKRKEPRRMPISVAVIRFDSMRVSTLNQITNLIWMAGNYRQATQNNERPREIIPGPSNIFRHIVTYLVVDLVERERQVRRRTPLTRNAPIKYKCKVELLVR